MGTKLTFENAIHITQKYKFQHSRKKCTFVEGIINFKPNGTHKHYNLYSQAYKTRHN